LYLLHGKVGLFFWVCASGVGVLLQFVSVGLDLGFLVAQLFGDSRLKFFMKCFDFDDHTHQSFVFTLLISSIATLHYHLGSITYSVGGCLIVRDN
jgi:hypothetical protein